MEFYVNILILSFLNIFGLWKYKMEDAKTSAGLIN